TPGLLRYLKSLRGEEAERYEELTDALDSASTIDYLQAMFDESLPDWDLQNAPVVIWLTHAIELPDEANTNEHHLYQRQTPRARAGMALYGLMSTMTREMYSTSPDPAIAVREESRIFHRSPAGQRESTRIITQGRKETMGLYAIDQDFETFSHIKEQYLPTRIITPYEHEEETRRM
ncbi:ATP-binding protein, partial [Mycobacteroides abscessus]